MTVRPGQYGTLFTSGSVGTTFTINNSSWGVLVSVWVSYVATATVGNRQLLFVVTDPTGSNILFQNTASAVVTAGQTPKIVMAAGLPNQSFPLPLTQIIGLPVEMPIGVGSRIRLSDQNAVDGTDTVGINIVYAM